MSSHSGLSAVVVSLSDDDIRTMLHGVYADVDRALEAIAHRVADRARHSTAFNDTTHSAPGYKHLRQSIKVKKSKYEDGGWIVLATASHAGLVEYGHAMVTHDGRTIGHVPAHSFLRSAKNEVLASLGGITA